MEMLNYEMMKNHQSFGSVEDMDLSVRGFLYSFKAALSESTVKVLNFIWRHSVKVAGVSFAKYNTIAKEVGVSRRTVIRAVHKLETFGFIKKIPTVRLNGKQGVNLLVIQPFKSIDELISKVSPQADTLDVTPNKTEKKQRSLCRKNNRCYNVKVLDSTSFDSSFIPETIHKEFIDVAIPFFHPEEIYQLWHRVLISYKKCKLQQQLHRLIHLVISAFKQTIFMEKMGKIHSSFEGYFYGTLYSKFLAEKQEENSFWSESMDLIEMD